MLRVGRKRKTIALYPSVQPGSATTQGALNALNAREQDKVTALVKSQPHRRDSEDAAHPWLASALGRLCLSEKCHVHLYAAGETYASLVHRWRAAKGVPRQGPAGEGSVSIDGPSEARVRGWEATISRIEQALEAARRGLTIRMRVLLLDDLDLPQDSSATAVQGLEIIAHHVSGWEI